LYFYKNTFNVSIVRIKFTRSTIGYSEVVTAQGGRKHDPAADKENEPPPTNRGKDNDTKKGPTRRKKALCPHCKAFVYHKPDKCLELEANKEKRWPGWKSIKATMA